MEPSRSEATGSALSEEVGVQAQLEDRAPAVSRANLVSYGSYEYEPRRLGLGTFLRTSVRPNQVDPMKHRRQD